jgi:DNA-binding transcriptional LysR family regulator
MVDFTLRQLEYFLQVVESGTIVGASRVLHLSQSALSTSVQDLERALGAQLLIRNPRGPALTTAGERVVAQARGLLEGAGDLERRTREEANSLVGRLSVGCFTTLAPNLLPAVIDSFTENYPQVDLSFVEGSPDELVAMLRDGTCELAVMYDYPLASPESNTDLHRIPVARMTPHIILPRDHPLARRPSVSLRQVAKEPLILFDRSPGREYYLSIFRKHSIQPHVRFRTQSFEMVRALVARGLGYALLSQQTAITTSYEGLEFAVCRIEEDEPGLDVVVVQHAGSRPTRRALAFIEECERVLAARP